MNPIDPAKAIVLSIDSNKGIEFLVELVKKIRPSRARNIAEAELKFQTLLSQLNEDPSLLFSLRKTLLSQFMDSNIIPALTESGVVSSRGFIQELIGKLKHKIIPSIQSPDDFLFVINRVFYVKTDYLWVEGINQDLWKKFFEILGIRINLTEAGLIKQLQKSLMILSYRIGTLGLEKEIADKFAENELGLQPFLGQNRQVIFYTDRCEGKQITEEGHLVLNEIIDALIRCTHSILWIKERGVESGSSLSLNFILTHLEQLIERMFIVVDVLNNDEIFDTDRFIVYFQTIIRNENRKNSISEFLSKNLGMVAYQVAEHKGKKGEKYIVATREEYWSLFRSSMGGGLIISFVAIIKNILTNLHFPLFWQGITYGTNYAGGFVLMDQTHTTLATKQPAYTASAIAASLDSQKQEKKPDLKNLAISVARTARSQIASFAGNLLVVFPVTYLLALCYKLIFGFKLAEGAAAAKLLEDQHPWHSLSILYACFTGFFLFLSGIIAGYVENNVVYGKIPERLKTHPILQFTLVPKRLNNLVHLVKNNAGAIAGSISLGFFLGFAGPIGHMTGLPIDIRHITISAGNTAIGFYGLDHQVTIGYLLTIILGVLIIGFLNFLVSFTLAFAVAVKSRGIHLRNYPEFLGILFRYFRRFPADFIRPPKQVRIVEELR